jgi:hypothetical protein
MKNYIPMLIYSIFSQPCTSIKPTPKLCKNCKYFIKPLASPIEFGKCALFLQPRDDFAYFITGKRKNKSEHYYCSIARQVDYLCGEEGKFYEDKSPPPSSSPNDPSPIISHVRQFDPQTK